MNVPVDERELERFVEEQVRSGRFPSPQAVVAHALSRLRTDLQQAEDLEPETVKSILRADEQYARGQFFSLDQVRQKFGNEVFSK
jgi:Arc/MetJ-type ribon-helix-helix transcriptional regulator